MKKKYNNGMLKTELSADGKIIHFSLKVSDLKRKLRLIRVVVPEIVAYIGPGPEIENMEPDYQCPGCGFGVADDYVSCPHCAAELDWDNVRKPSKSFRKLVSRL